MSANDGGPAFPREDCQSGPTPGQAGMSLRDYFAAKVLASSVSKDESFHREVVSIADERGCGPADVMAKMSYVYADAMLKARQS